MKKNSYFLLFLLGLPLLGLAQQIPHYSQYMLNPILLNPAVSGTDNYLDVRAGYRNQWTGLEGAPTSYYMSAHMPLGKLDYLSPPTSFKARPVIEKGKVRWRPDRRNNAQKTSPHHGVGILVQADKAAGLKRTEVQFLYAYHQPLTPTIKLAAGIAAGFTQFGLNRDMLTFAGSGGDPVMNADEYNRMLPSIGVGTLLYSSRFFLGASVAQVLPTPFGARETRSTVPAKQQRHFFGHGGYRITVNHFLSVTPSVVVKYAAPSPLSVDVNTKVFWRDQFWVGGSYRLKDAAVLMAGFQYKHRFHLGYAYDLTTTGLNQVSYGSHELVLGLMLRNRHSVYSPSQYW
jgi:type IX secretion system PorP/SprF family membrane protein